MSKTQKPIFSRCTQKQFEQMVDQYQSVARFAAYLEANTTGSPKTYSMYMRAIHRYSEFTKQDPDELIGNRLKDLNSDNLMERRKHEDTAMRFFGLLSKHFARMSSVVQLEAVKTFYRANHSSLDLKVPKMWTEHQDKVPTLEEVRKMVGVSNSTLQRAVLLVSSQSGQRAGVICSITYGMVKTALEDGACPAKIEVPPNIKDRYGNRINKHRASYSFFIGRDSIDAIESYLHTRKNTFGQIQESDFLFVAEKPFRGQAVPLDQDAVNRLVKRAAIVAGLMKEPGRGKRATIHHHCLRKFWQTTMEQAQVPKPWYEYMMGHKVGGNDASYSKPTDEQLCEAYQRAEYYVSITPTSRSEQELKQSIFLATLREQALLFGIDPAKIRIEKQRELGTDITLEGEIEVLREEFARVGKQLQERSKPGSNVNYEAAIVGESQLVQHLEQGWDLIQETNSGKYILRRPALYQTA